MTIRLQVRHSPEGQWSTINAYVTENANLAGMAPNAKRAAIAALISHAAAHAETWRVSGHFGHSAAFRTQASD